MKVKINWLGILIDVIRVVIAGIAGGAGAAIM